MAFERFNCKGQHESKFHCSVGRGFRIIFSVGLVREYGVIPVSATTYFDAETNRIGVELSEDMEKGAYRIRASGNTFFFAAIQFAKLHRIREKQHGIAGTIEDIDGKKMIVFTVKVEQAGSQ